MRNSHGRLGLLLTLSIACAAVFSSTALAGTIYFQCGTGNPSKICKAGDNGKGKKDFAKGGSGVTASLDGKRVAYSKGSELVVADSKGKVVRRFKAFRGLVTSLPKLNRAGTEVAWSEQLFNAFSGSLFPYICRAKIAGKGRPSCTSDTDRKVESKAPGGPIGWFSNTALMGTTDSADNEVICTFAAVPKTAAFPLGVDYLKCRKPVAIEAYPSYPGVRPEMSPKGNLIVNSVSPTISSDIGEIATYNPKTGKRVRKLTTGKHDFDPVFSPDGKTVLFTRDGSLYKVPVGGGKAKKLIKGTFAAWSK